MSLKTTVKVGNITNLSDARYAAGMGADMLGFSIIPGQPNYIETNLFQQIRGWITGPKIVAELYGITPEQDVKSLVENHLPDYVAVSLDEYTFLNEKINVPFIVSVSDADMNAIPSAAKNIIYWLVDFPAIEQVPGGNIPLMIRVASKTNLENVLSSERVTAIALSGSAEIRPGFKDYDELAEILEALED